MTEIEYEAVVRAERAGMYAQSMDWDKAAEQLARLAVISAETNHPAAQAQALYTRGTLLRQLPAKHAEAVESLQMATSIFTTLDDKNGHAACQQQLAAIYQAQGDTDGAMGTLDALHAMSSGDAADQVLHHWQRSVTLWQGLEFAPALEACELALAHALRLGEDDQRAALIEQIEWQRSVLQLLVGGVDSAETITNILDQRRSGPLSNELAMASHYFRQGAWEAAFAEARSVRLAVDEQVSALPTYLMATLLMVESADKNNDRIQVLAALLTAKTYLSERVGTAAAAQIEQILNSLAGRWGDVGLQNAVAAYQQHIAEYGPFWA